MDDKCEPTTLHVIPLSAQAGDRWRLSEPYVEHVWTEHLGPTATLPARRLGRMIDERPGGIDIDLGELAAGLGASRVSPLKLLSG